MLLHKTFQKRIWQEICDLCNPNIFGGNFPDEVYSVKICTLNER